LKTYLQKNPLIEEIIYLTLFVDLFKQSAQWSICILALSKNNTKVNFVLIRTIYKVGDYCVSPDCLNSSCNKKYLNARKGDNLWIDILQERDADREKIKIMTEEKNFYIKTKH
jgi:hypothetical protein